MDNLDQFETDEISIKELLKKIKDLAKYIFSKRLILIIFSVAGFILGILFSLFESPNYIAVSTFVLEESGHGAGLGLSQYSGLAAMAGIELGGGSDKGLFQGDNILELYKSRKMIEKTLLTLVNINGKKHGFAAGSGITPIIQIMNDKSFSFGKNKIKSLNFNNSGKVFSRQQDSVIREITKYINKYVLVVSKPDKKLSIINVEVRFTDENFSQLFNQNLVQNVNNYYVQTQTRKTFQSVQILQHQADSVRQILDNSIGKVAESTDLNPYPNPLLHSLQVPYQKKQIDVQANSAIYTEIVKNLEISKISLRQETPLIQIVDEPILPLEDDKTHLLKASVLGLFFGLFLSFAYLLVSRFYVFMKNA